MPPGAGRPEPEPAGSGFFQVVTAVASRDEAAAIARALLEERAAACVQVVGPVESSYWWQGAIESATEFLCVAKTTAARLGDAMASIERHHSYDVPEITAVPVERGSAAYLQWIEREVAGGQTGSEAPTGAPPPQKG